MKTQYCNTCLRTRVCARRVGGWVRGWVRACVRARECVYVYQCMRACVGVKHVVTMLIMPLTYSSITQFHHWVDGPQSHKWQRTNELTIPEVCHTRCHGSCAKYHTHMRDSTVRLGALLVHSSECNRLFQLG